VSRFEWRGAQAASLLLEQFCVQQPAPAYGGSLKTGTLVREVLDVIAELATGV